jgi:2-polyprenyl-6-methoxyphenol hydroxylase-like FAD-dependent oxidoreductase
MRVLVVGAGIAGLSTALRLRQLGIDVTVAEQADAEPGGGYMIDFFGPGIDAAHQLGLDSALRGIHAPVQRLCFVDRSGRQRFAVNYGRMRRQLFHGRHFNFLRGDLERVLLKAARRAQTKIIWGRRVVAVRPAREGSEPVLVRYADGATERWDVVIGADGVNSAVRRSLLTRQEWSRRDLGHTVAAWIQDGPVPTVPVRDFTTLTAPGRMVAVYPAGGGSTAIFFAHRTWDTQADFARGLAATLRRVYGDLGWVVPRLLRGLSGIATRPYFDSTVQVHCTEWQRGRVALVGDACWCVSLLAGQGASLAVAGGLVLAEELAARPDDVTTALGRYRDRLEPTVNRIARSGLRAADWFIPDQRWRGQVRDLTLRGAAWPVTASVMNRALGVDGAIPPLDEESASVA